MSNKELASHWLRVAECYRQCASNWLSKGPATYQNHEGAQNSLMLADQCKEVARHYMS